MMRCLILLFCSLPIFGQHLLSVGLKGGVPATDAFSDSTTHGVDVITHAFSDSKKYVIGPMVELNLPLGLSIEADALYRPLNLTTVTTVIPRSPLRTSEDFNSWEFPILGKYHFLHTPIVKPYAEAGPIFRHVAQVPYPSNSGFAIGAGVDFKLLLLRVTPEIRYTRWRGDAVPPSLAILSKASSNQNQAQFLIGVSF
jgi:hypothetical protein